MPPTKTQDSILFPSTGSKCDHQQLLTSQAFGTCKWNVGAIDLFDVLPKIPDYCCLITQVFGKGIYTPESGAGEQVGSGREKEEPKHEADGVPKSH